MDTVCCILILPLEGKVFPSKIFHMNLFSKEFFQVLSYFFCKFCSNFQLPKFYILFLGAIITNKVLEFSQSSVSCN
eukprot:Pgem_evm1s5622